MEIKMNVFDVAKFEIRPISNGWILTAISHESNTHTLFCKKIEEVIVVLKKLMAIKKPNK